jgi:phage replication O-like protein O
VTDGGGDAMSLESPQLENGFIKIANELWDALCRTRIPGEERQVLDVIFRKTYGFNKKSDSIPLSQFEAATGLTRNNVCASIKQLEQKGFISLNKETGKVTTYRINKNYSQWLPVSKKRRLNKESLQKENLPVSKKRHSKDITKDNNHLVPDFEFFYLEYPRKKNRGQAEKAWLKLKPSQELLQEMLAALEWQRVQPDWVKDGGQYIPYPASWLNAKGWLDEKPVLNPQSAAVASSSTSLQGIMPTESAAIRATLAKFEAGL